MTKSEGGVDLNRAVAVWIARISDLRESQPMLETLLDDKERERALRFRFAEDRARFVSGRGLLRLGLRRFAPQVPASLELAYTSLGRPVIPKEHEAPQFSISHTRDVVAVAFAAHVQVGIDLEFMQATVDLLELAERILSEEDFRKFQILPHRERQLAFYRAWTRKEAYLKARGEGIAAGLQQVSVSFSADKVSQLTDQRDTTASAWRLYNLPVPSEYRGSLACDDAKWDVACFLARLEKNEVCLEPAG